MYVLKIKNEVLEEFKEWCALIENQTRKRVKMIRTDNGLKFCSSEFDTFYKQHGIVRYRTVKHTPQKNKLAKRMNKTLIEKVICMLFNANLSKYF